MKAFRAKQHADLKDSWSPPLNYWIKVNCDATFHPSKIFAGIGAVL